jgi:hypothetical protein
MNNESDNNTAAGIINSLDVLAYSTILSTVSISVGVLKISGMRYNITI